MGPIQEEVGCKMDNFLLLVIGVLFILSAGFLILYFQTQQSLQEITKKLEVIQQPQNGARTSEAFKRELALNHDKLVVMEADITKNNRESLTEEELKTFDVARNQIKKSIAGLKANGDWVGIPFEYEWTEMLDRLPNVLNLYRKAEADKQALELAQENGQKNDQ
jgi:endo-alpha-1,4-polygalactosaminidase (GH114 family)